MRAVEFIYDLTEAQREIVRHNWMHLGYVYVETRDMVEMWRNPETDHTVEMATY